MNILKLKTFLQIDPANTDSIDSIKSKYSESLNSFDFRTTSGPDVIKFKKKIRSTDKGSAPSQDRVGAFNVLQEGQVDIFIEYNKLNINWAVELDHLYFLSIMIGLVLGFAIGLYQNFPLYLKGITGLIVTICSVIAGIFAIINKIDEINNSCLE